VVMTRPLPACPNTLLIMAFLTTSSPLVRPGERTLVESDIISVMPSLPAYKNTDSMVWFVGVGEVGGGRGRWTPSGEPVPHMHFNDGWEGGGGGVGDIQSDVISIYAQPAYVEIYLDIASLRRDPENQVLIDFRCYTHEARMVAQYGAIWQLLLLWTGGLPDLYDCCTVEKCMRQIYC